MRPGAQGLMGNSNDPTTLQDRHVSLDPVYRYIVKGGCGLGLARKWRWRSTVLIWENQAEIIFD